MKTLMIAAAAALALSGGAALADTGGGGAIANNTTTSMGAPASSPGYTAPRSAVVPGLAPQQRMAQQENAQTTQTDQGVATPVQGPNNPITGHTQTTR